MAVKKSNPKAITLKVDSKQSEIRILVYRAGLLGDLGHNHVLHTSSVKGSVKYDKADVTQSKVQVAFTIDSLIIDNPERRDEEGEDFPGVVPEKDIEGTRKNMDTKVLHTKKFPKISAKSIEISGAIPDLIMTMAIDIHGKTQTLDVPVNVKQVKGRLRAKGQVDVLQSDLGIKPLKILLGTIAVQDEITIKLDIVAQ